MLLQDYEYHLSISPLIEHAVSTKERIAIVKEGLPNAEQLEAVSNPSGEAIIYKIFEEHAPEWPDASLKMAVVARLRFNNEPTNSIDIVGLSVGKYHIPLFGGKTSVRPLRRLGESVVELVHKNDEFIFVVILAGGCPVSLEIAETYTPTELTKITPAFNQQGFPVKLGSPTNFTQEDVNRQMELMGLRPAALKENP